MRKMKVCFLAACFLVSIFSVRLGWAGGSELELLKEEMSTMQQKMGSMQKRIEQLETGQAKVENTVKSEVEKTVKEEIQNKGAGISGLTFRGYFGWHYEDETKRGANPTFDAFLFALIPKWTISDKIDLYSQLIFEHAPFYETSISSSGARTLDARTSGEFTVNDVYLTYTADERLKLRAGKFAAPFGLLNTLMYAAPTYVTVKQPGRDTVYNRGSSTDTDANLFGRYSMGAWILGSYDIFSYDFYVANGRTKFAQHKDDNRDKAIGGRLGVNLSLGESNLKLLYSHYQDRLRSAVTEQFFNQRTDMFSLEFGLGDFKLSSEIADSRRRGISMNDGYILAQYNIGEKLTPFFQYQIDKPDRHVSKNITHYFSIGSAYHIIPWRTLLKIQMDRVAADSPSSEDYNRYLFGVTTVF